MLFCILLFSLSPSWKFFQIDWDCSNLSFLNGCIVFHDLHMLCNLFSPAPIGRKCSFPMDHQRAPLEQSQVQQSLIWGKDLETYLLFRDIFRDCLDQGFLSLGSGKTQNSLTFSHSILPFQPQWSDNRLATVVDRPRGKRLYRNIIIGITNKNSHYHCCHCDYCNLRTMKNCQ